MTITLDIEEVTAFAKAVRRELVDLAPETLDELIDGLEADLADKLADGEPLGDAAAYAAELRTAAGVAPAARESTLDSVRANIVDLRARIQPFLTQPLVAEILSFFVALRPVWWLVRGWALFYILAGFTSVPQNQFDPWLLVGLLVLSVQWGRAKWLPWRWSRGAVIALSVIAVLVVPALVSNVSSKLTFVDQMNPSDYISDGILLNKQQVSNIFAYGPDGKPLRDVRLYDQQGNPLSITPDVWGDQSYWAGEDTLLVPSQEAGTEGWNVYPLQTIDSADLDDTGSVPSWAKRVAPTAPFASVQQLLGYEAPASDDVEDASPTN